MADVYILVIDKMFYSNILSNRFWLNQFWILVCTMFYPTGNLHYAWHPLHFYLMTTKPLPPPPTPPLDLWLLQHFPFAGGFKG